VPVTVPFRHGHRIVPEGAQIVSYRRLASNMASGLSCGLATALAVLIALPSQVAAQSADGAIGIELNSASDIEGTCRLTYVITNGTTTDLAQASWEVAVHDAGGVVTQLWVLDFGSLPQGRTRVVQFDMADQRCNTLSRISVNDAVDCQSAEGAVAVCREKQSLSSRVEDIAFN
jgi:hypothetical protein